MRQASALRLEDRRRHCVSDGCRPMIEELEARCLMAAFDVLVFSRTAGFRHDAIAAGTQAIRDLGTANDFSVFATEDPAAFNDANLAQFEAVVFLLTTGDVLNTTQQAAFERFIANGKGYVGIHSAADTEYGWSFYGGLVGAYFSNHPAIQQATIKVADQVHPATAGLPQRWVRTDEWYNYQINPRGNVHVLATLDETTYSPGAGAMGFDHPISWAQQFGGGRSFYTGLGHTISSYSEPLFRQHILGGIRWAAGNVQGDVGATVNASYQKTVLDADTLDPMALDVAPDGRVFFVQRGGAVKVWSPLTSSTTTIGNIAVETRFEDGLLGIALDPNFAFNNWLYLFYSPAPADANEQRVSRFTVVGDQLDPGSEKILLHIPVQRTECCHSAGSLDFGPDGTLYIATGDNTNPFESNGYAPIDERPGRSDWDAQKSSANTNDLRGKILRIRPELDGTYTIPAGNLFAPGTANTRPEIFVMGNRNPFRISVDSETGWLYWGDVGPDANGNSATRGPMGHDEFNQARSAGNFGWPYFVANNQPYNDFDFATATSGPLFNPAAPINNSPNNTGAQQLPAARGAWIWYPYSASTTFPELGSGGRTAMAGPVYHHNPQAAAPNALPRYYDDTLFIYDWARGWIKEVKIDQSGNVLKINPFASNMTFRHPMDMKIGADGAMYILEWGSNFNGGNADSQLIRIDYVHPRLSAAASFAAQATSGRSVELSWSDDSIMESGYKIERRQPGQAFAQIAVTGPDAASYRDDTVSPGSTYEYRIRSFVGLNNSPFSPSVSARTWIKGDLNGDGSVSIADFITLSSNFNMSGGWPQGDLNGDGLVTIGDFIDLAANFGAIQTPANPFYTGVNLAGAEFGATPTPGNLGTYGSAYIYPNAAEVDYYISKGMDTFRLPFRWERLQPTLNGAFSSAEFSRLNNFVSYATSKGAHVILEPHNFARFYPDPANFQSSTQGLIGSATVPYSAFANFWSRLAEAYKSNPNVIFNLMNEPNTMPTQQWVSASNAAIAAIRAAGANNLILVPGNGWTGAWTWHATWYGTPNATAMLSIVDPGNNYAYDVHQYLDTDGSGTSSTIHNNDPTIGVQRLTAFTNWLRANNRRGFLGEFAVANSTIGPDPAQIGDETLINMLNYIGTNDDVWLGWAWWSGGPWWGEYRFALDPTNLGQPNQTDRPAMAVLRPYTNHVPQASPLAALAAAPPAASPATRRSMLGVGKSQTRNRKSRISANPTKRSGPITHSSALKSWSIENRRWQVGS